MAETPAETETAAAEEVLQGYQGMLPVQEKWLDHLMSTPTNQWPADLLEFVQSQGGALSWDAVTDAVGRWIKLQRD